jgi:hypothetical protein
MIGPLLLLLLHYFHSHFHSHSQSLQKRHQESRKGGKTKSIIVLKGL